MSQSLRIQFRESEVPITECRTKFGGQPVWYEESEWPISKETNNPMRFICQIELDESTFPNSNAKMAYIFLTDEEEYVDGTWEPDGGENAIILQPGTHKIPVKEIKEGPTLQKYVEVSGYDRLQPLDVEYEVDLKIVDDPSYSPEEVRRDWSDKEFEQYASILEGNKISGTPIFLQYDEFPEGEDYRLLIQLDSTQVPFDINFGDAGIGYGFINCTGTEGKFLWQCA